MANFVAELCKAGYICSPVVLGSKTTNIQEVLHRGIISVHSSAEPFYDCYVKLAQDGKYNWKKVYGAF